MIFKLGKQKDINKVAEETRLEKLFDKYTTEDIKKELKRRKTKV